MMARGSDVKEYRASRMRDVAQRLIIRSGGSLQRAKVAKEGARKERQSAVVGRRSQMVKDQ